jgi:hypothetical protein
MSERNLFVVNPVIDEQSEQNRPEIRTSGKKQMVLVTLHYFPYVFETKFLDCSIPNGEIL